MIKTMTAKNIDRKRPIVTKKYKSHEMCDKCGIRTIVNLKIVANANENVIGDISFKCSTINKVGNKKERCNNPMKHNISLTMPSK